jgi:hypothetical protein
MKHMKLKNKNGDRKQEDHNTTVKVNNKGKKTILPAKGQITK